MFWYTIYSKNVLINLHLTKNNKEKLENVEQVAVMMFGLNLSINSSVGL